MPNRILRDGINQSESVNSLSEPAEIFYRRLMSAADDFGRWHADPRLLRAELFPLQLDRWPTERVLECLVECAQARLLEVYEKFLVIINFNQRIYPTSKSRFPDPAAIPRVSPQVPARASPPTITKTPSPTIIKTSEETSKNDAPILRDEPDHQQTHLPAPLITLPMPNEEDPAWIVGESVKLLTAGGRPVPIAVQTFAETALAKEPRHVRIRLLRYIQWAFSSELWSEPGKTMSLKNLILGGDWNVDITPEMLHKSREPPKHEQKAERMEAARKRQEDAWQ